MKRIIYADNAATTKLDPDAFEAMKPFLLEDYGNASQPYFFSRKIKKALQEAREIIAQCIGALPEEIYFTSGGTESDNWAIKGTVFSDRKKRETITSAIEHHAILHTCEFIEKFGVPVTYLQPDRTGIINPEVLRNAINENTRLVSVMFSNNEIGTIEPIKELAEIAHEFGALFHTDAVQAIGHTQIDVNNLGVDMLSASAHKFNGPKGIGFLYIRKGVNISPFIDGGSQEIGKRAGTENVAAIVGMSVALKNNCDQLLKNERYINKLEQNLLDGIKDLDYIRNGAQEHIPGNISLSFRGENGESILHRLDLLGICVSTGSACNSGNEQSSHVLQAIKLDEEYARGTIRISLGKDNSVDEVKIIYDALNKVIAL